MSQSLRLHSNHNGLETFESFDKMFAPLVQRSVGFDRVFDAMNTALRETGESGKYPPYDIVQAGSDDYTITMAVAGFGTDDIEVKLDNGVLSVTGSKAEAETSEEVKYLHRGIANRRFQHRFRLTDHIRVEGASLKDGILTIQLVRELPEALKPRVIELSTS